MDLYGLLKQFNNIGGIEQTGQPAFCLLMVLWQKSNELQWANEFTMTNTELLYRAGFNNYETLRRTRNKLRQLGFFEYKKPSNRKNCGTYILEFDLLKAFGYGTNHKITPSSEDSSADSDESSSVGSSVGSDEGRPVGSSEDINKLNITKHNKKEKDKKEKTFSSDSLEIKISEYLYKKIFVNDPKYKKPNMQKWAEHVDKLIRLDKRNDKEEIRLVIDFATSDNFWRQHILSTKSLRDKYPKLRAGMQESKSQKKSSYKPKATKEVSDAERKSIEKLMESRKI